MGEPQSAIGLLLEYNNGVAMELLVPYSRTPAGKYEFGEEQMKMMAPVIFSP